MKNVAFSSTVLDLLELDPVIPLSRDQAAAAKLIPPEEIRLLVDHYYTAQDNRLRAENQQRAMDTSKEPHDVIKWVYAQNRRIEDSLKRVLDQWTSAQPLGRWARRIPGIGPVLSAGLRAHISIEPTRRWHEVCVVNTSTDPERQEVLRGFRAEEDAKTFLKQMQARVTKLPANAALTLEDGIRIEPGIGDEVLIQKRDEKFIVNTAGKVLSFGGWRPGMEWKKGQRRPWNADLKTIFFLCGESFIKVSGKEDDIYGHIYLDYKRYIQGRNERGDYAGEAKRLLEERNYGQATTARKFYERGLLSPGHIHARARRYAVKIFVSNYHDVAYTMHFGKRPPLPFAIGVLGHADYIEPPFLQEVLDGTI